jgi:Cu(I)/Ag(I) efflux system membrane fusion protein
MTRYLKRLWPLVLIPVFFLGYLVREQEEPGGEGSLRAHAALAAGDASNAPKAGTYACPMNCVPPMAKPGKCPVCGMDMMPIHVEQSNNAASSRITLSKEQMRRAGIQTARVTRKFVNAEIRMYGKIEYDPIEQYKVTAYAPGVIDNIYVKRAGQVVRKGDPLFDLHSSELYYLEQELFETLAKLPYKLDLTPARNQGAGRVGRWTRLQLPSKGTGENAGKDQEQLKAIQDSLDQIQRKMRLLGMSENDVDGLIVKGRATGIATVTTPMTGVVLEQNAFRGAFVNTGDVVFTIANPRVLWARLNAYASDFPWIRLGQDAEFETDAYPGKTFQGKVTFIDPEFDLGSRVFKVGVLYQDQTGLLKPNMLVRCVIHARMTSGGRGTVEMATQGMMETPQTVRTDVAPLVIPDTAPLATGERAIVYVELPKAPGTFEGREVRLGPRAQGYYIVHEGLRNGERVVVNGNFKIDSAVQIQAKPSMLSQKNSVLPSGHYNHVVTPVLPEVTRARPTNQGAQYELHGAPSPDAGR